MDTVGLLLEKGAKMDLSTHTGRNALMQACQEGHTDIVGLLLQSGARVDLADEDGCSSLFIASKYGHTDIVRDLLKTGAVVDMDNEETLSSLMCACLRGHRDTVRLFLEKGANVNLPHHTGRNALIRACEKGHTDIVSTLLQFGAKVDFTDTDGCSSLYIASKFGHTDVVRLLLKEGADIDATAEMGRTALFEASSNGHTDVVKVLLESGANIHTITKSGWTSLVAACGHGHYDIARMLLNKGYGTVSPDPECSRGLVFASQNGHAKIVRMLLPLGEVDMPQYDGKIALVQASKGGHLTTVEVLLQYGAKVDIIDGEGVTGLSIASQNGHSDTVILLIHYGAEVDLPASEYGMRTALMQASQEGHTSTVRVLLEAGADVNRGTPQNLTSLMIASNKGHVDTVQMLIQFGASVNAVNQEGQTSLRFACSNGQGRVINLLMKNGATLNLPDLNGITPLMAAVMDGHYEVVQMLLEFGGRIDMFGEFDVNSLQLACTRGYINIVRLLLENGVNVDFPGIGGETALMTACEEGYTDIVRELLGHGAVVNQAGQSGDTGLHCASRRGYIDIVKVLLLNGVNVSVSNVDGRTALMMACQNGHADVVRLLLNYGANVNAEDNAKVNSLVFASGGGHAEIVKLLLDAGADVDYNCMQNTFPLLEASAFGHLDAAKVLLNAGANRNMVEKNGVTGLHMASEKGHIPVLKLLLQEGSEINLTDKVNRTALSFASYGGCVNTVRELIANGAQIDVADDAGNTALTLAAIHGNWETVRELVKAKADVLHRNVAGENAITYLALAVYSERSVQRLLEDPITKGLAVDIFHCSDYGISVFSAAFIGAFLNNVPVPQLFYKVLAQGVLGIAAHKPLCLYGYLPRVFFTHVIGPDPLYLAHLGTEVKISLHTLHTAVVCKLPVDSLQSLSTSWCGDWENMLGQNPLHLLAMENQFVGDMKDKILFMTENLGISFSQKDHNGRVPYHIACMWGNAQFLLCGLQLDPDFRSNMNVLDHLYKHATHYMLGHHKKRNTTVPSLRSLSSMLSSEFLKGLILNDIFHDEKETPSDKPHVTSIEKHFHQAMSLSELILVSENNSDNPLFELDIVSLFTDANKGVVNLETTQHSRQIVDVIELLQIVGTEMGKIDRSFECVLDFKGSVQENTKCGSLDELDVAMYLVNFADRFDVGLEILRHSFIAHIPSRGRYWNEECTRLASVKICTDFCRIFMKAIESKPLCQFLKQSGIVIEHYQRKHGFVGNLTLSCHGSHGIQTMSVDVVPCFEGNWGYTPLLRPKKYEKDQYWSTYRYGERALEVSSYTKDWEFLKYVPVEVLCGYVLAKLLRSQASTFQAEDGQVYSAEDILPSYMLKTALLWILDPEDKINYVYPGLLSIFPLEPVSAYNCDVLQLSVELLSHTFEGLKDKDVLYSLMQCEYFKRYVCSTTEPGLEFATKLLMDYLTEHTPEKYEQRVKAIVHKCVDGTGYLSPRERVLPYILVTKCRGKNRQNGIDLCQMIQDLNRNSLQKIREEYAEREHLFHRVPVTTFTTKTRQNGTDLAQIIQDLTRQSWETFQEAYVDKTQPIHLCGESYYQGNADNLQKTNSLGKIDKISHHDPHREPCYNTREANVDGTEIIYNRDFYCRDDEADEQLKGSGFGDRDISHHDHQRKPGQNIQALKVDETEIIQDREPCYDKADGVQQSNALGSNVTNCKVSYPDISEQTARRARLWAKRILHLLPKLLNYQRYGVEGLRNYYLPEQEIYSKDRKLATALCKALEALL